MRYILAAFLSRPQIPLLRFLPWNVIAVGVAAWAGLHDPQIWLTAGAFETLYLLTLATNPSFQRTIDGAIETDPLPDRGTRDDMIRNLGGAARQRFIKLEERIARIEKLSRDRNRDDLFIDGNRQAMRKLSAIYLQLLTAQRNYVLLRSVDPNALKTEISDVERSLNSAEASETLQKSQRARLDLLSQRLTNLDRREEALAEVESDLARIDAQIDVALDGASLEDHPVAVSGNIELVTQLIVEDSRFAVSKEPATSEATPGSAPPEKVIER